MRHDDALRPSEVRRFRALRTPWGVQRMLDGMAYHLADTAWSPRRVLATQTAHCLEAAIFAAAALEQLGHRPLILDLEAVQDTDHVVAIFRARGRWGAVAKSNFSGLCYREPVYLSLRELVMSYFDQYMNLRGDRTLRAFSRPVDLRRFDDRGWRTAAGDVWFIPEHLLEIPHTPVVSEGLARRLHRVGARCLKAALVGHRYHR